MPYLQVDLLAKKRMSLVARAAGVSVGEISWGLLELWEHAWELKKAVVSEMALDGCFGPSERIKDALVANDFIERVPEGWRVRGAERYLRISKARSEGGKTRASNATRNADGQLVSRKPKASSPPAQAGEQSSSNPALALSIEHRASNIESTAKACAPPPQVVLDYQEPKTEPAEWLPDDFHAWAQSRRKASGYFPERPPNGRKLSAWYSEALMSLGGRVDVLQEAFYRFGESKHWESADPPYPFKAFMSQWDRFVPRKAV